MSEQASTFRCAILDYAPPGRVSQIGVLVWDDLRERIGLLLRSDWRSLVQPEDSEYFEALTETLSAITLEGSVHVAVQIFEDSLSNTLRIRAPQSVHANGLKAAAEFAWGSHVPLLASTHVAD